MGRDPRWRSECRCCEVLVWVFYGGKRRERVDYLPISTRPNSPLPLGSNGGSKLL